MAKQPVTQWNQRRFLSPSDQFGRKWHMSIEIITGDPTGAILPAQWDDPLATPGKYVEIPREGGQTVLGRCEVRFDKWIQDIEQDERSWYQQLHENALQKYSHIDPLKVDELDKDKFLLSLTGPKPWPSSDVLRAAQQGHRGFLGLTEMTMDDRAALKKLTLRDLKAGAGLQSSVAGTEAPPAPPETYKEFIQWAYRFGGAKTLPEVGAMWQKHREALNAA